MRPAALAALSALLSLWTAPAHAQEDPAPPVGGVEQQLQRLTATVAESNQLLRRLVLQQEAGLYVRRLELAATRVDQAQQRLVTVETEQVRAEDRRRMLAGTLEQLEALLDRAGEEEQEQLEIEKSRMEVELKAALDELTRLENAAISAENELRFRRDALVELQELLDDAIEELLRAR